MYFKRIESFSIWGSRNRWQRAGTQATSVIYWNDVVRIYSGVRYKNGVFRITYTNVSRLNDTRRR